MNVLLKRSWLSSVVLMMSACASGAMQPDQPAVLTNVDAAARAELGTVIGQALGRSVTLADDALTRESTLIIEPSPVRGADGRRLTGRDYGKPERFSLVKHGDACVLIQERNAERFVLRGASCRPR